jgi:1,4-dihydroxy-2-naphthoyl-CoA hydrolase
VTYEFTWQARSSSVDETEHIYHPELFRLVDEGIEALLEEIGVPLSQLIPEEGYALPIVHAEADFTAPIRFGDEVACRIDPDQIGRAHV